MRLEKFFISKNFILEKKVAVVILNWNGKKFLEDFLPSVTKFSANADTEIVVADNGSTDDSIHFLKKNYQNIKILSFDKNYGFAEGYNKALSQLSAEYFVLLNSDVEVTENWIQPIIALMDKDKTISACMPKIRSFYEREKFEYAGAAGGFIDFLGYPFCRGRILNVVEKDSQQYDSQIEIFWATGACMFVRAEYFNQVEGLDGDFFAHMEEIDLCWRLKNRGYKVVYCPEVCVYHVGGGTLPQNSPRKILLNFRNNLLLLYKNLPSSKLLKILIARFFLDFLAILMFLVKREFSFAKAVLKAYLDFFAMRKLFKEKREKLLPFNNQQQHKEIYRKSIVFDFFLRHKKFFNELSF